jgi:hypothetical protein
MKDKLSRGMAFFWKLLFGGFACQFPLSSLLVIGWTFRAMRRTAVKHWWSMSERGRGTVSFREDGAAESALKLYQNWPRWFFRQDGLRSTAGEWKRAPGLKAKARLLLRGPFGSLKQNLVLGIQGIFNVAVLTGLPALLWQFGWYAGWDNSFNKGYEQFNVGQLISLTGVALFLVAMLYVPMAQARQGVTGEWRSFYQFKTVWRLIQRRRLASLVLAGFFSLLSIPLSFSRIFPVFLMQDREETRAMSDEQLLAWVGNYYFWVCIAGFIAFVALRLFSARIYAGAIVEAYRAGALKAEELGAFERHMLGGLRLVEQEDALEPHVAMKIVGAATRPVWRAAMTGATLAIWFTFVTQIYVSEFLVYHQTRGFVNQPLIHLPWFRYVPKHLEESVRQAAENGYTEPG